MRRRMYLDLPPQAKTSGLWMERAGAPVHGARPGEVRSVVIRATRYIRVRGCSAPPPGSRLLKLSSPATRASGMNRRALGEVDEVRRLSTPLNARGHTLAW
jgi:hypothetical protein